MSPTRPSPAILVILSGMVAALHIGKMPPAIPVLRDALGISLVEAGFLLSMVQMAGMLVGVMAGLAADGVGLRRAVISGQTILALASLGGIWVEHPAQLLALRALEGLGFLLVALPAPGLIRQLVPPSRLALHLGLWGTYMATGMATVIAAGPLVMATLGWGSLWALLGLVSAAMAVLVALRVPSDAQRRLTLPPPPAHAAELWWHRLRDTLSRPGPWKVALAFSTYSSQWLAVVGFLPSIYAQAGQGGQVAGLLSALAVFVNITGSIAAGRLLHRGVCAKHLLYFGFISMALTAFVAFGTLTAEFPVLRYLAVLLFSAIGGLIPGTLFSLAVHVAPSERTVSTTVGWMQQCSSTGQFISPPIVAWCAGALGGWQWTWVITGSLALIGLLLATSVSYSQGRK